MEIIDLIIVLSVVGMVSGVVITTLYRLIPAKKTKNAADSSISDMYSVYNQQVADVLKLKDNQIKSQANKLKRFEDPEGQDEEDVPLPPELLGPIAKKLNMTPEAVQALIDSPQIKKLLKGNKDLLPLLLPMLGKMGGNTETQYQPEIFSQNSTS